MDKRIAKVVDYIGAHLHEDLTLPALAARACLSVVHFHRIFKASTGQTPFRYIESLRMTKAYEMVVSGEVGIQDMAIRLSYSDYETFSRAFKKYYEFAPHDMRVIAQKLREEIDKPEQIIIATAASEEEVMPIIQRMLEKNRIKTEDLEEALVYKVEAKKDDSPPAKLINNKFEMVRDQSLINQIKTHNP